MGNRGKKRKTSSPSLATLSPQSGTRAITEIKAEHRSLSGPLPPPDVLREYDEVHAGTAERIIAMAERQQTHRHKMEDGLVECEIRDQAADRTERRLGQVFALAIGFAGLGVCAYAIGFDREWSASIIGGGTLGTLTLAFLKTKGNGKDNAKSSSTELEQPS